MSAADRLHALDAVRASALLLGIALHGAQPYIAGLYWMTVEKPDNAVAALWYTIHMFRMPLFFLIAGLFGRMQLERRGTRGFINDRTRRILIPLVAGMPLIMLLTGAGYVLGGLLSGVSGPTLSAPPSPGHATLIRSINLMHLWFLYYLALFYAVALAIRGAVKVLPDLGSSIESTMDKVFGFLVRSGAAAIVLAIPIALYYGRLTGWSPWGGLPAPFLLIPDAGALLAYGSFFGCGWLLHRQLELLATLEVRWPRYGAATIALWICCRALIGSVPHWGPILHGATLVLYTACYVTGAWCGVFALIGLAMRYLSQFCPVRRYLADASYWIYLMHIAALIFFAQLLHPLHLPAGIKYGLSMTGALAVLLLSYHYLVRFTFIGALLNGRRQTRAGAESVLLGSKV